MSNSTSLTIEAIVQRKLMRKWRLLHSANYALRIEDDQQVRND